VSQWVFRCHNQLEILEPIVTANAIFVVYVLIRPELSTYVPF